jgi:hypothetical protein
MRSLKSIEYGLMLYFTSVSILLANAKIIPQQVLFDLIEGLTTTSGMTASDIQA